jgi:glutamate-1-semialdehyde aminotransferase
LKASGKHITTKDEQIYLDMSISGIGACILGYAHPEVDEAVIRAIRDGVASSINSHLEPELAERLIALHPHHDLVRYCKSGGEANVIAVRLSRAYTRKSLVLFCGYHGWHDWYLAANHDNLSNLNNHLLKDLAPLGVPAELSGTAMPFEYNVESFAKVIAQYGDEAGCIIMEPARATAPDTQLLELVRNEATKRNIPLIFDEISSGFRTTNGALARAINVEPDISVFAKSLGNGYPIAAIVGNGDVMTTVEKSFVSSTNWTEATGLAAALSVLDIFERDKVPSRISELGLHWLSRFDIFNEMTGSQFQTSGLPGMIYFSKREKSDEFRTFFTVFSLKEGLLTAGRFYPNFQHDEDDITLYFDILGQAWDRYCAMNEDEVRAFCGPILPGGFNALRQT